jgi:poly(3-hydroxybutyrate) depolymerase
MKFYGLCFSALLIALYAIPVSSQEITKELITAKGQTRAYYLFVPEKLDPKVRVPLVVLLHGSGRNGLSLAEKWKDLAKKEKIIVVGPDASESQGWRIPEDGPAFIYELVEALKAKYPVNSRRVYLFGHSAGAGQALYLSLLESEYFAATAVHAGALQGRQFIEMIERAKRKIPIAIWVGTNDNFFPLPAVRATRDALNAQGFNSELTEIKGHTHWYYDKAPEINRNAFEFLRKYELTGEPVYEEYQFNR